jgi:hypothetical protein
LVADPPGAGRLVVEQLIVNPASARVMARVLGFMGMGMGMGMVML